MFLLNTVHLTCCCDVVQNIGFHIGNGNVRIDFLCDVFNFLRLELSLIYETVARTSWRTSNLL
jgi:hypothetical protein